MAKFYHLSTETEEAILNKNADSGLENFINAETLGTRMKGGDLIKVKKMAPEGEFISGKHDTVLFMCDEEIYENLDQEDKDMLMDDAFCRVYFDGEKDALNVNKTPIISMTVDAWRKYGASLANAYEKVILIREQMEEKEKERKQAEKDAKAAKRKQNN